MMEHVNWTIYDDDVLQEIHSFLEKARRETNSLDSMSAREATRKIDKALSKIEDAKFYLAELKEEDEVYELWLEDHTVLGDKDAHKKGFVNALQYVDVLFEDEEG